MMRANPKLLKGVNLLWIRFFQVAVFATMFVRDHARPEMHKAMGLNPEQYGLDVFRITTEISKQVFPVVVDTDSPRFLAKLRQLEQLTRDIGVARKQGGFMGRLKGLGLQARTVLVMASLLLLPAKANGLPERTRMAASW